MSCSIQYACKCQAFFSQYTMCSLENCSRARNPDVLPNPVSLQNCSMNDPGEARRARKTASRAVPRSTLRGRAAGKSQRGSKGVTTPKHAEEPHDEASIGTRSFARSDMARKSQMEIAKGVCVVDGAEPEEAAREELGVDRDPSAEGSAAGTTVGGLEGEPLPVEPEEEGGLEDEPQPVEVDRVVLGVGRDPSTKGSAAPCAGGRGQAPRTRSSSSRE